jgi:hypothetical protein
MSINTFNGPVCSTDDFDGTPSTTSTGFLIATDGDTMRIKVARSPTSSGSGDAGEFCWDTSYFYICTATNTWKRVALTGGY